MRTTTIMLPFLLGVGFVSQVQANEESEFILGLGIGSGKSIYKGVGTETDIIPLFAYQNESFYIQGPEVGYHFIENGPLTFSALASYRLEGYESGDSRDLKGMDKRKGAFELGVSASYETDIGDWSMAALTDISNEHDGYEIALGWEKRMELTPRWSLTPGASISYRSKDLNNYYYGVKNSEATASRAAYTADSGTVFELGVSADYMIDPQQMVRFGASYQNFGSEISDSSIVEKDNTYQVSAAYIYRF